MPRRRPAVIAVVLVGIIAITTGQAEERRALSVVGATYVAPTAAPPRLDGPIVARAVYGPSHSDADYLYFDAQWVERRGGPSASHSDPASLANPDGFNRANTSTTMTRGNKRKLALPELGGEAAVGVADVIRNGVPGKLCMFYFFDGTRLLFGHVATEGERVVGLGVWKTAGTSLSILSMLLDRTGVLPLVTEANLLDRLPVR